jgi:hypothetical protein
MTIATILLKLEARIGEALGGNNKGNLYRFRRRCGGLTAGYHDVSPCLPAF